MTETSSPARGVIPLVGAIVATVIVPFSFVSGIGAALDGSGSGSTFFQALFIAGLALALSAIVISIVSLVRGAPKLLPILAIVVALLPFVGLLVVILANVNAS